MSSFSIIVGFGASLGIAWMVWQTVVYRSAGRSVLTSQVLVVNRAGAAVAMLTGSLIGSRVSYLLVNAQYYQLHPELWLHFSEGGLTWPGAVAGALTGFLAASFFTRIPFFLLADSLIPVVLATTISIWIGCLFTGVYYGPQVAPGWWALQIKDLTGEIQNHFPLQPLAALIFILYYNFLDIRKKFFNKPGQLSGLTLLGLAVELVAFSFLRGDPLPQIGGLRMDTWSALIFSGLMVIWIVVSSRMHRRSNRKKKIE
jgi:prolipoprotein diacylglyceryltransferase